MGKLVVIAVHGVSDSILKPGYSSNFFALVLEELKDLGVVPRGADQEQVDSIVKFQEANYSKYGVDAENRVEAAFRQDRDRLFSPITRFVNQIALLDRGRHLFMTVASDVFTYQLEACKALIRQDVYDTITPYVGTGDMVSVAGHSLGSVVAFDSIYYNVWNDPAWKKANFMPSNLFTFGSPLLLFSLDPEACAPFKQKARYDPNTPLEKLLQPGGVWYNFLDPQDLIAQPLGAYFQKKYPVTDVVVDTGIDPYSAHLNYWKNRKMARSIAERLKMDYARMKSPTLH